MYFPEAVNKINFDNDCSFFQEHLILDFFQEAICSPNREVYFFVKQTTIFKETSVCLSVCLSAGPTVNNFPGYFISKKVSVRDYCTFYPRFMN